MAPWVFMFTNDDVLTTTNEENAQFQCKILLILSNSCYKWQKLDDIILKSPGLASLFDFNWIRHWPARPVSTIGHKTEHPTKTLGAPILAKPGLTWG